MPRYSDWAGHGLAGLGTVQGGLFQWQNSSTKRKRKIPRGAGLDKGLVKGGGQASDLREAEFQATAPLHGRGYAANRGNHLTKLQLRQREHDCSVSGAN